MFILTRLLRRKDYIDDTAAAYIEGRATEREQAELRDRAAREPALFRELDSMRDTVSLLRSVEPVAAPRSFALAQAPVQVRVKRSRLAMAPAVFAIAAAAAVGLLAVGNLADIVRQSDGSGADAGSISTSKNTTTLSTSSSGSSADGLPGPQGPPGDAGVAGSALPDESVLFDDGTFDSSALRATESVQPNPTTTAAIAIQPSAPSFDPALENGEGSRDPGFSLIFPGDGLPLAENDAAAGTGLANVEPLRNGSDDPKVLPQSTTTNSFDLSPFLSPNSGGQSAGTEPVEDNPGGVALPIWQLQLAFAGIAVLMAGAWMLLQRRLTA